MAQAGMASVEEGGRSRKLAHFQFGARGRARHLSVTPPRRAAQAVLPGLRGTLHPAFRLLPCLSGGGGGGGGGAALLPTRQWWHAVLLTFLQGTEDRCARAQGPG